MTLPQQNYYEFDSFRLDRRGLFQDGKIISLPPKVLELLFALVDKANDVLSKEELMARLWPDVFVEESNLTNYIGDLRKALADKGGGKQYIETYSKRGYSFVADVRPCSDLASVDRGDIYFQRHGFFSEFLASFPSLIEGANEITLFFIHSRRWRENYRDSLVKFLKKERTKLNIFLPNITNINLIDHFRDHFEDGPHVSMLILDAYQDFARLALEYKQKVFIRPFNLYPVYSFYKFDRTVIVAMYPNTSAKKSVPTFEWAEGSMYWDFVEDDIQRLLAEPPLSQKKLRELIGTKPSKR